MDKERFERMREAFVEAARLNEQPRPAAKPRRVKLSAVTGPRAAGVHMAIVPPENEAPYSSVHESLCGIGNDYYRDLYWRKTTDEPTCAECVGKADELYAEGAELFDPESYQVRGWHPGPPEMHYELCPVPVAMDGMLDLPTVSIPKPPTDAEIMRPSVEDAMREDNDDE